MRLVPVAAWALVTSGTVAGALAAARVPESWVGFGSAVLVLACGLVLLRKGSRSDDHAALGGGDRRALVDLVAGTRAVSDQLADGTLEEARLALDELARGPVFEVAQMLPEWEKHLRFERYAAFASAFAYGERLFYRAWSAATDDHREETVRCLRDATSGFSTALDLLDPEDATGL